MKTMMSFKNISLLLALLCPVGLHAAKDIQLDVQHITTRNGLPANSVRSIMQDSKGFIWIGTINNGLCKYDGTDFRIIRPTYDDGPGLADQRINSIQEDAYGYLWVVTMSEQVSCYDLRQERFVDYSGNGHYDDHYGHVTFCDDGLWLWGTTQGCMNVKYKEGRFVSQAYTTENSSLPSDYITFLISDSGVVWIGTKEGLCRYKEGNIELIVPGAYFVDSEKFGDVLCFISSGGDIWRLTDKGLLYATKIDAISDDGSLITGAFTPDEESWVIFTTKSAYRYDVDENVFYGASYPFNLKNAEVNGDGKGNWLVYDKSGNVVFVDSDDLWTSRLRLNSGSEEALWTTRYDFTRTSDEMVWISTHDNGLFAYDISEDHLFQFDLDALQGGNASNILMCVEKDNSGNLWIGSEFSGIFKVNVISKGAVYKHFNHLGANEYSDMVRMISTHDENEVWVSARDGNVYVFDKYLRKLKRKVKYDSNLYAVYRDSDARLWLGTRGKGLIVEGRRYLHASGNPCSLSSDSIFDIIEDNAGNIWIGTFGGGVNLAIDDGKGGFIFRNFFNDTYSRRHIRALALDINGYIWVGSSNGVTVFNPEELITDSSNYLSFNSRENSLRSNECRAIVSDSEGRVYIAETGAGFSICVPDDYSDLKFRHFGPNDGLISGLVQGFVEDHDGKMWITTEYGVSCFDPHTDDFTNYIFSSDMHGNVCLDNSTACTKDGRILIGTNGGLAIIDPEEASCEMNRSIDGVVFTTLKIHGVPVIPDDDSSLRTAISYAPEIILDHDNNTFSLSFSSLDYTPGIKYTYILEGYDEQWSQPTEINEATYRQVPHGNYVFRVKACNSMGEWQTEPTKINVIIRPPFYKTAVAYLIYVILLLAILYFAWRIIARMTKLRNDTLVEKQLTEYKLVFFTNISHEFRTPLTLILHSLEKLRESKDLNENGRKALRTMESGTNRLMRLVNQLIEFRKIQNNKHVLRLEQTDVIGFCQEIFEDFRESASAKNLDFQFLHSEQEYNMYLDRGDMDKVVYNLISNAIKYTPEGGMVSVSVIVSEQNNNVKIEVRDKGLGIPKHRRKDLFVRFSSGESSESSMGIGLHLTKSLVDANKGEINYTENPGGGTVMTVILPTNYDIYEPEDFKTDADESPMKKKSVEDVIIRDDLHEKPARPINPHKILVIEDEPDIRRIIVEELKEYFNVLEAPDGNSALDILHGDKEIDLVVCDVMMPGMSGYEVTAAIKEDIATCHIPVILLTALSSDSKKLEGIKSGADAYITKPFRPDYIFARIFNLLEQRARLREKFSSDLSVKAESICTTDIDREFMDKVDRILEVHLGNPDFSMDDFASEMAMGRSSFYAKIHNVTGYSPNKYIRILRMKKAAELILTGKYTAAEVAYKVGIQDASYFGKSFKEQFGISPKAYYKKAMEGLNQDSSQDE